MGESMVAKGHQAWLTLDEKLVGWIFQDFHLLNNLSALDNVAMALELSGVDSKQAESRASAALERVGL